MTLSFALAARNHAVPVSGVMAHVPEMAGLTVGGLFSAIYGTRLVLRMSHRRLTIAMAMLLAALGVLLLIEAFVPFDKGALGADSVLVRALVGVMIGLVVGVVSSMLGVAGGELLIPTLVFVFGADIRVAGSASLIISLAIVATGVWRYHRVGALPMTGGPQRIAMSMKRWLADWCCSGWPRRGRSAYRIPQGRAGIGSFTRCGEDHPLLGYIKKIGHKKKSGLSLVP